MPDSKPGYNLHPRYNRPILRRQRRNDGRRENTHGKTKRRTAGRKPRPERQAGRQRRPARNAHPRQIAQNATQQQIGRRSEDQPRQTRSAASGQHSPPRYPVTVPAALHPERPRAGQPAQIHPPRRRRSAAADAVKAETARTDPRGRTRPHARSPGHRSAPKNSQIPRISPSRKSPLFPKKRKSSFCAFLCEIFKKFFFLPLSANFCPKMQSRGGLFLHKTDTKSTSPPHNSTLDGEKTTIFLTWYDKKRKFTP